MGTLMIAHRGLSGLETENTLQAFERACKRSYYGIECDVHITADGKYVIFHDDNTGRMCVEDLVIEKTNYKTLRALAFKDGVSRMPSLEEYLEIVAKYNKIAVIELKNHMSEKNIREIIEYCKSIYNLNNVIFISFDRENLLSVRRLLPEQKAQFLTCDWQDGLAEKLKENGFGLDIGHWALTDEIINELHANGVLVNCWTCDDEKEAARLISIGADFITTNILE